MLGPNDRNDLKSISDFNSRWADRVAYLILAGLLVDIAALFIPEGKWKIVASIGANLLIFGGVWGELWFAKRAREADDSRVAEANVHASEADARAAEANLKAVEAQIAFATFRAPRTLTCEQQIAISEKIRQFFEITFDTGWAYPNAEQHEFIWRLECALTNAGWVQVDWPGGSVLRVGRPKAGVVSVLDVSIQLHPSSESRFRLAAAALVTALNDEGIAAAIDPLNVPSTSENAMHVMIGIKR